MLSKRGRLPLCKSKVVSLLYACYNYLCTFYEGVWIFGDIFIS